MICLSIQQIDLGKFSKYNDHQYFASRKDDTSVSHYLSLIENNFVADTNRITPAIRIDLLRQILKIDH